jgi:hypothetical protein
VTAPIQSPVPVAASPRHGARPAAAPVGGAGASAGSIRELLIAEDDLALIGVAWFRVGLAADGRRLVLEGPVNGRTEGGMW